MVLGPLDTRQVPEGQSCRRGRQPLSGTRGQGFIMASVPWDVKQNTRGRAPRASPASSRCARASISGCLSCAAGKAR
eukprot:8276206-Lingulodinium_polyedra.AAC.1